MGRNNQTTQGSFTIHSREERMEVANGAPDRWFTGHNHLKDTRGEGECVVQGMPESVGIHPTTMGRDRA